jgi:hypothetical protein
LNLVALLLEVLDERLLELQGGVVRADADGVRHAKTSSSLASG